MPPESPICTIVSSVVLSVDTPLNMIVIRLAHVGMPVKSIFVPDVELTTVPLVKIPTPDGVPAKTGEVIVGAELNTLLPDPVLVITPVPPLATARVADSVVAVAELPEHAAAVPAVVA